MNGCGRNIRHKPQRYDFLREQAHGPVIMPVGRWAASDSDQVSGLQAREGTAPVQLHFVVQDGFQSPLREAPSHIGDRCLTHIEGSCQFCGTPSVR